MNIILAGAMIGAAFVQPRHDCAAMRGTTYTVPVAQIERQWFKEHCLVHEPAVQASETAPQDPAAAIEQRLTHIAECESGGDAAAVSPDVSYRGLLQFDLPTWRSVGGTGDPAQATAAEQLYRGTLLVEQRGGYGAWPVCRYAG